MKKKSYFCIGKQLNDKAYWAWYWIVVQADGNPNQLRKNEKECMIFLGSEKISDHKDVSWNELSEEYAKNR